MTSNNLYRQIFLNLAEKVFINKEIILYYLIWFIYVCMHLLCYVLITMYVYQIVLVLL